MTIEEFCTLGRDYVDSWRMIHALIGFLIGFLMGHIFFVHVDPPEE